MHDTVRLNVKRKKTLVIYLLVKYAFGQMRIKTVIFYSL